MINNQLDYQGLSRLYESINPGPGWPVPIEVTYQVLVRISDVDDYQAVRMQVINSPLTQVIQEARQLGFKYIENETAAELLHPPNEEGMVGHLLVPSLNVDNQGDAENYLVSNKNEYFRHIADEYTEITWKDDMKLWNLIDWGAIAGDLY